MSRKYDGPDALPNFVRDEPLFLPETLARVIDLTMRATDLRDGSEELAQGATTAAEILHITSDRANVLRATTSLPLGNVLEVGAECGAVTRFLGENSRRVVAVETNPLCAAAARNRCRDLSNVAIVDSLPIGETAFDCALVIGGPERIRNLEETLKTVGALLSPGAKLILTSSNSASLDVYAGSNEPRGADLVTLKTLLSSAGFQHVELLHPFPGWRSPRIIVPAAALGGEFGDAISNLLESVPLEQDDPYFALFSTRFVWRSLIANGTASVLANAFTIIAQKEPPPPPTGAERVIAFIVNTSRPRCFQKTATLSQSPSGIVVRRKRLHEDCAPDGSARYRQIIQDEPYVSGHLLSTELYRRLNKPGWVFDDVLSWARRYADLLERHAVRSGGSDMLLPPNMVDCTPFNIAVQPGGATYAFDLEWAAAEPLPLVFVLFRGLLYTLLFSDSVAQCGHVPTLIVHEIVRDLVRGLGYRFDLEDIEHCWGREQEFQLSVAGGRARFNRGAMEAAQLVIRRNRAEMGALARAGDDLGKAPAAIRAELEETRAALDRKNVVLDVLMLDVDRHRQAAARSERRVRRLQSRSLETRRSMSELKARLTSEQQRADEAGAEREQLAVECARLRGELSAHQARLEQLQREVHSERANAAANIPEPRSRPLRALGRLLSELPKNPSRTGYSLAFWLASLARCVRPRTYRATRSLMASGLFDREAYLRRYPDVTGIDPLAHYLAAGEREGRSPSPLFDERYYRSLAAHLPPGGLSAVSHFLHEGGLQGKSPSKYFDSEFYLRTYPDVLGARTNPLIHYLRFGAREGRNPAAWFHTNYYLAANPDVAASGVNPLAHYAVWGKREGREPGPPTTPQNDATISAQRSHSKDQSGGYEAVGLFDREYYLSRYPDSAQSGMDPLAHYISTGANKGYNPHPLFHTRFYLEKNEDVRKAGVNPLLHFVTSGAWEGRNPNPVFDCAYYLKQCPELRDAGINPLQHYLDVGASEGRDPNPMFSTAEYIRRYPDSAAVNPLVHYYQAAENRDSDPKQVGPPPPQPSRSVENAAAHRRPPQTPGTITIRRLKGETSDSSKRAMQTPCIICLSHVCGWPPRAGNDYRIYRMLTWLQRRGYSVVLLVAPLPDADVSEAQAAQLTEQLSGVAICERDGLITTSSTLFQAFEPLEGTAVQTLQEPREKEADFGSRERDLLQVDRTFCHDTLIAAVQSLRSAFPGPSVILAEYIFMSRALPLIAGDNLKIIDTIDVFSTKQKKVVKYGVDDALAMSAEEERARLQHADLVVAIQNSEREELAAIIPERPIITVGVDFDVAPPTAAPLGNSIFYIASDNSMNVKGLRDFLRFAWPWILRDKPDAFLKVAGNVCSALEDIPRHVELLGPVGDSAPYYREAKLTINPAIAGTGLKIKTVEALCFLRPIVSWPNGVEGMDPELARLCYPVTDWREFARRVVEILQDPRPVWFSPAQEETIRRHLSPEHVYAPLEQRIAAFFQPVDGRARS